MHAQVLFPAAASIGLDSSPNDTQTASSQPASVAAPTPGTSGPAAAGSAATGAEDGAGGSKLLAEVDSLLCGVAGVQRRLAGSAAAGGGTVAAEDDGICIDEPGQPAR